MRCDPPPEPGSPGGRLTTPLLNATAKKGLVGETWFPPRP